MLDKNEFYRQATLRIFSSLNIETALGQCKDYLCRYMPVSGIFFAKYEPDLNICKITAGTWPSHFKIPRSTIQLPWELWGRLREEWERGEQEVVRIANSFSELDIVSGLDRDKGEQILASLYPEEVSQINLSLILEKRRIGFLQIFAEGRDRYRNIHADLISMLQNPFAISMSNILQHQEIIRLKDILSDDNSYLRQQMVKMSGDTVIGANSGLRGVMEMVHQVAQINSPVLLLGETGVGKEIIANTLHYSSKRKNGPLIKVNCGAIPENLVDSELFGHEKGAFTGALSRKRGRFERAHGGTIFLDEIGELPLAAQVRLLRVLQHHEIERVGGKETIPVDVRIVSATHRNMEEMVRVGSFREDLWYRLNVFPIMIPPLRQRVEDIPTLLSHFLEAKSKELKIGSMPAISEGAVARLCAYHWPGNVRELENLVERALIRSRLDDTARLFTFEDLPRRTQMGKEEDADTFFPLDHMIVTHIEKALKKTDGRIEGPSGAAKLLELKPSTLRSRMRKFGIRNDWRPRAAGRGKSSNSAYLDHSAEDRA